ncbi:hypothetical protein KFK14_17680 [Sphingobium phenoxybenzoativorans]|uniref:Uncharacterized protein n=1 Tax=Sphingobium phenoxybenzoativorans TaxID=1592790 RepID=A0A975KC47_9SPHN|nr:hypothetical protein [Sphingobium phenoxybenzoativorans]QUT08432.1 hypothetical protein KFK14_17680 [Sphingobium phenoxybenzoativorans]
MEDASPPANALRGEFDLVLEGEAYTLRPSYEAIIAFERGTGKTLLELARASDALAISLEESSVVVTECIRAYGRETQSSLQAVQLQRITEMVYEAGLVEVVARLGVILWMAVSGGCAASGKAKTTGTTNQTTETPVVNSQE